MTNDIIHTLSQYKETISLIVAGVAWSITHIVNKMRKWEAMTFKQHLTHLIISGFVWLMAYHLLEYIWITGSIQGFIIWFATYSAIQIVDAVDMIKAKTIYNLFIDFIKFKIWK